MPPNLNISKVCHNEQENVIPQLPTYPEKGENFNFVAAVSHLAEVCSRALSGQEGIEEENHLVGDRDNRFPLMIWRHGNMDSPGGFECNLYAHDCAIDLSLSPEGSRRSSTYELYFKFVGEHNERIRVNLRDDMLTDHDDMFMLTDQSTGAEKPFCQVDLSVSRGEKDEKAGEDVISAIARSYEEASRDFEGHFRICEATILSVIGRTLTSPDGYWSSPLGRTEQ